MAAFAATPVSAIAQDNLDMANDGAADDNVIIVTAQKIEQKSTDVPITISAVSGEQLRELGVSDLDELSNFMLGLYIQEQSANSPSFGMCSHQWRMRPVDSKGYSI